MWNVSYVKWTMRRNGTPKIWYTYSRSFRYEKYARQQYKAIIDSMKEGGFSFTESEAVCEGVRGHLYRPELGRNQTVFVVVYISENEPSFPHYY